MLTCVTHRTGPPPPSPSQRTHHITQHPPRGAAPATYDTGMVPDYDTCAVPDEKPGSS